MCISRHPTTWILFTIFPPGILMFSICLTPEQNVLSEEVLLLNQSSKVLVVIVLKTMSKVKHEQSKSNFITKTFVSLKLSQSQVKVKSLSQYLSLVRESEAILLTNRTFPRLSFAKSAEDLVPACFSLDTE